MTAEAAAGPALDITGLPSWTLDEGQLGDLELLLMGVFAALALGLGQHAEFSMLSMHDIYVQMGIKLLRAQRAQLLPPISEVALQMFVSHFEYLETLLSEGRRRGVLAWRPPAPTPQR